MDVPQSEPEEPEEARHGDGQRVDGVGVVGDAAAAGKRRRLPHLVRVSSDALVLSKRLHNNLYLGRAALSKERL